MKYVNTNNGDIMKENINALDELNKGTTMGMEAIGHGQAAPSPW